MRVDAYIITKDRLLARVDAGEMSDDWFTDEVVRWIKITSAAPGEVEQALRPLELQPRIVTACAAIAAEPDVVVFEKALFIRIPVWNADDTIRSCLRIVSVATTLITIQDEPTDFTEELAGNLQRDRCLRKVSTAALILDLAEAALRSLTRPFLTLRTDVDGTADTLEKRPGDVEADDLLALKRRAGRLSGLVEDYLYCVMELQEAHSESLQLDKVRVSFQELVGDIERAQRLIVRMEDRIRDLRQASLNYLQEATNRRLNILAVLSAIYLPSTLIAGIYGMNFEYIPIIRFQYGYFVVLALMIGLVVGQLWIFYRGGWFK